MKALWSDGQHLPPEHLRCLFPELGGCHSTEAQLKKVAEDEARTKKAAAKAEARKVRAQEKEARALARGAQVASAHDSELGDEVDKQQEQSVMLRAEHGLNFKDAIRVGPFDLPHPSGGLLIENASFSLTPGHRYGLIGRNGKGKSTLLRNLAARRVGGLKATVAVHYVSQDASFSDQAMDQTPVQVVVDADVERKTLLEKARSLQVDSATTVEAYTGLRNVLERLEAIGAESAEHRATRLLVGLGFSDALLARPLRALSGGWRVRVALAGALFAMPDVLMLDEPTNHLSMQAVLWLCHELCNSSTWKTRTVIVVSHDRYFLDSTSTDILHVSGVAKRLTHFGCGYTAWLHARAEQQKMKQDQIRDAAAKRAHWQQYITSGQAAAGNVSSGDRKKKIRDLDDFMERQGKELAALEEDAPLALMLQAAGPLPAAAVQLRGVGFAYPGSDHLFRGVGRLHQEFTVNSQSRIVLVGENGNGKTTLLKLLRGELEPTEGLVEINRQARFALVNQHHAEQIDLKLSPMQFLQQQCPGDSSLAWELKLQKHLETCGVTPEQHHVAASALSGGQRSRLAMAAVSLAEPHILFMDEPTNNLDLSSIEALAQAVERFDGGVVLVSHDQHFVSRIARECWVVGDGAVRRAESFEAYRAELLATAAPGSSVTAEAVDAYVAKKLAQSGGQVSRLALAKDAARLLRGAGS